MTRIFYKLYTPLETIIRPIVLRGFIVNEQYEVGILSKVALSTQMKNVVHYPRGDG